MKISLKNICSFQSGGTPSKQNSDYFNGNIPWITTVALNGRIIDQNSAVDWITEKAIQESAAKIVPAGSIMVGTRVGVGKVAINAVPMSTSQDIISLVGIDGSKWNKEYLCKFLQSKESFLKSQSRGATIKGIKIDALAALEVPGLPLSEQEKIVSVLNHTLDIIEQRKAQLAALDELVKARFVEMFGDVIQNNMGWSKHVFSEIASSRLGKMLDAKQQKGICKFPYLANFNVQWFRFELKNLNEMDFDKEDQLEFELKDGDLLVCEGGEIGRCAVWHNELQPCYFQKALHRVRCNTNIILPDYMARWFQYNCEHGGFSSIEGAKATISHLPGAKLKTLQVVTPPIDIQKIFVDFVAQVDKTKANIQKSFEKSQLLFDSLMQEYFG